jgi:hypothetical protein
MLQADLWPKSSIPVCQIDRIEQGVTEMKQPQAIQLASALDITLSDTGGAERSFQSSSSAAQ